MLKVTLNHWSLENWNDNVKNNKSEHKLVKTTVFGEKENTFSEHFDKILITYHFQNYLTLKPREN